MRNLRPVLLVLPSMAFGALLMACLTAQSQAQSRHFVAPKPPTNDRWEYRDYHGQGNEDDYKGLNELGAQGWEAYAYTATNGDNWELKRRK